MQTKITNHMLNVKPFLVHVKTDAVWTVIYWPRIEDTILRSGKFTSWLYFNKNFLSPLFSCGHLNIRILLHYRRFYESKSIFFFQFAELVLCSLITKEIL